MGGAHLSDGGLQGRDVHHGPQLVGIHPGAVAHDHHHLGREVRVADPQPHQEPVELRLGQPVGARHLDRVLGGDHQERPGHLVAFRVHGDRALGHHLQQRRLGLRGAAVDLVGEHHVGEHPAGVEREALVALVVDLHAGDVAGQQVRGELDPVPGAADAARQAPGERGLAEPRHVLDEQVAPGQQRRDRQSDHLRLAAYDRLHVGRDPLIDLARGNLVHPNSQ